MQVDECITKYAKIVYLLIDVQFYKYSKIAYFGLSGAIQFPYHHAQAES